MSIFGTHGSDRGMTLAEVMIASSVLLVCLTSLAGLLSGSVTSSRMARIRDEAANLANEKIEYARSLAYDRVGLHYSNGVYGDPAGDINTPEQVGSFTVTTECTWVRTSTGRAAYKKLNVHVGWKTPMPGEIVVTTIIYGKSDIVTSGDLVVKLRYRENGDPVQNASVAIVASNNSARSVLSDEAGETFFGQVALGTAALTITPPAGCVVDTSTMSSVSISADSVTTIIAYVQRPAQATVHLTSTSGGPLSGATVTVRRVDGVTLPAVVTDTNGDAVIDRLVYADYSLTVTKAGYPSVTVPFTVTSTASSPVIPISMSPLLGVGLQVRAYDINGTPVADASVTVRRAGDASPLQTGTAATNGEISFAGLNAGDYTVTVDKVGYISQVKDDSLYDGDHDTVDFYLSPVVAQGNMRITTLTHEGNTASLRVVVSGPNGYYRNNLWSSNPSGVLNITALVPGSYQVRCFSKPSSTATVIINGGQTAEVQISQSR